MKTEIEIENEILADELRKLFFEALEAVLDPVVMDRVQKYRKENPQFKYDARTLAVTAIREKRALAAERAALANAPSLSSDPTSVASAAALAGKSLFATAPIGFGI